MVGKPVEELTSYPEESSAGRCGVRRARHRDRRAGLAATLADVLGAEHVPVDGHFFDDLGADSMVMARFCARVRKRADLPSVSIKDIYRHPTIGAPGGGARRATAPSSRPRGRPPPQRRPRRPPSEPGRRAAHAAYVLCGRCSSWSSSPTRCLVALVTGGATSGSPPAPALSTSTCGRSSSAARLRRPVRLPDPREVGARRPVEAAADPGLEPGLRPLLGRQDPGPREPAGPVRRLAAVRAVPAGAGREDRAGRRDLLPATCRSAPTC